MITRCCHCLFVLCLLTCSLRVHAVEIIACGGSQVLIFDADPPGAERPKLTWTWDVRL